MFLLALLSLPAQAEPFGVNAIPYTTTFNYSWTSPASSGSTSFIFETAARANTTTLCQDVAGCMDGDFSTGNGGVGTYFTDLYTRNCSFDTAPPPGGGAAWVPYTCDLHQSLELTYATTSAVYSGSGYCGEAKGEVLVIAGFVIPVTLNRTYTYLPGLFTGTLSGPGTGTFTE